MPESTVGEELAGREIARRGRHRLLIVIDEVPGDVAFAVSEVRAHESSRGHVCSHRGSAGGHVGCAVKPVSGSLAPSRPCT